MKTFRRLSIAQQTAQHLRDGIRQGRWKGRLPGVVRLSQELGVSTHTLRASLRLIEKEGLVELSQDKRSRHVAAKAPAARTPSASASCSMNPWLTRTLRSSSSSKRSGTA